MGYILGGDISHWQGEVDFAKAATNGWKYVYSKATQATWTDDRYKANRAGARAAGLLYGAFHFLVWNVDPVRQAEWFWGTIKDDPGQLPPCCDFEWNPGASTPKNALDILKRFMVRLGQLAGGRKLAIYTSPGFWSEVGGCVDEFFEQYLLWVAWYEHDAPAGFGPWKDWFLWQTTGNGDGRYYGMSSGGVDLDQMDWLYYYQFAGVEPGKGANMWENNAVLVAFDTSPKATPVKSVDFAALKAAGVHGVLLRCGEPENKLYPDWPDQAFRDSATYGAWLQAAEAAGLRVLVEYPFTELLDEVNGHNGSVTLRYLNYLLSGGKVPKAGGGLIFTLESLTWLEGGDNHVVTATATNYGDDLQAVYEAIWNQFHLVPGFRTGRWFLDSTDKSGKAVRSELDFLDKQPTVRPAFFARWRFTAKPVTGDIHLLLGNVPDPAVTVVQVGQQTVNEQAYYLYYGNYARWMGYECGTATHPAVLDAKGVQTPFRVIIWHGTAGEFDRYFNWPEPDVLTPTTPVNLRGSVDGQTVTLLWEPASDNVGVVEYNVYQNGTFQKSVRTPGVVLTGVSKGEHVFAVDAEDAAGNRSTMVSLALTIGGSAPVGEVTREEFETLQGLVARLVAAIRSFGGSV